MFLRVLTYNIQNGRGIDWRIDLARIAAVVTALAPDVVAFQEVDIGRTRTGSIDQAAELGRRLAMPHVFAPAMTFADGLYGLATMTRLPIASHHHVELPAQPHRYSHEPRIALVTELVAGARRLRFINTHLSTSHFERPDQATRLLEVVGDQPDVILVGDFNCSARSRPQRSLCMQLHSAASPRSWPSPLPLFNLDHILYRGLRVVTAGVARGPGYRVASDHLPLVAEFEL